MKGNLSWSGMSKGVRGRSPRGPKAVDWVPVYLLAAPAFTPFSEYFSIPSFKTRPFTIQTSRGYR